MQLKLNKIDISYKYLNLFIKIKKKNKIKKEGIKNEKRIKLFRNNQND